jgi:hypothetical protein
MMTSRCSLLCLLLLLLGSFPVSGCRRGASDTAEIAIELEVEPSPLTVGPATLLITLRDAAGNPIEDARLDVKGDMSHAGMAPVLRTAEDGPGGIYVVPFEWTMGGDWFVTVDATLADGSMASRRFDFAVAGGMPMEDP